MLSAPSAIANNSAITLRPALPAPGRLGRSRTNRCANSSIPSRAASVAKTIKPASETTHSSSNLTCTPSSPTGPSSCTIRVTSDAGPRLPSQPDKALLRRSFFVARRTEPAYARGGLRLKQVPVGGIRVAQALVVDGQPADLLEQLGLQPVDDRPVGHDGLQRARDHVGRRGDHDRVVAAFAPALGDLGRLPVEELDPFGERRRTEGRQRQLHSILLVRFSGTATPRRAKGNPGPATVWEGWSGDDGRGSRTRASRAR